MADKKSNTIVAHVIKLASQPSTFAGLAGVLGRGVGV